MIDLFFSLLLATGIGQVFILVFNIKKMDHWSAIIGMGLTPPLVVFAYWLGASLQLAVALVTALSVAGTLRLILTKKIKRSDLLLSPVLWCVVAFLFGDMVLQLSYKPHLWDEFTHWLVMPKQLTYYNDLVSTQFLAQEFVKYLPGLTLWHVMYELLIGVPFNESHAHVANFAFAVALLPPVNHTCNALLDLKPKSETSRNLVSGLCSIIVLFLGSGGEVFYPSALIEPASYIMLASILFLILNSELGLVSHRDFLVSFGLLVTGGYFLKEQFVLAVPAFVIFYLYKYIFERVSSKVLWDLVALFIPAALLIGSMIMWKKMTLGFPVVLDMSENLASADKIMSRISERSYVFLPIIGRALQHFTKDFLIQVMCFWGLYHYYKHRSRSWGLLVFWSVHFLGLLSVLTIYYLFGFSDYEASILASIHRYLSYHSQPLRYIGLSFFLVLVAYPKLTKGRLNGILNNKLRLQFLTLFTLLLCFSISYWSRFPSAYRPAYYQYQELLKLDPKGSGLLIAQGQDHLIRQEVLQYSIGNAQATDLRSRILDAHAYAPSPTNIWTHRYSHQEMVDLVGAKDFIWLHRQDEFIRQVFQELRSENCPPYEDGVLIVKKPNDPCFGNSTPLSELR
jgi:hypothetical protein